MENGKSKMTNEKIITKKGKVINFNKLVSILANYYTINI